VLRLFPSPWLPTIVLTFWSMLGLAVAQDAEKKEPLPPPRVVSDGTKAATVADNSKVAPAKVEDKKFVQSGPKDAPAQADAKPAVDAGVIKDEPKTDAIAELKAATEKAVGQAGDAIKRGDNAWMLTAAALVLLMTPGLALFYGGMVRRKNVLATMMQSYASMAVVGLYWVAVGYGLAFGPSQIKVSMLGVEDGGIIGWDWRFFFLQGVTPSDYLPAYNIPVLTHVMFQGMFAIITPALISGAVAERIRFWPWTVFMILWVTFVYCPLAHMVWAFDWYYADPLDEALGLGGTAVGLLGKLGALDFAGGTVVHIAAGFAGLACVCALRKRTGYPEHAMHPNSMVLTLIGAALLWVGWFGFNGGSSLNSSDLGSTGFATTQAAAAAAGLSWILVEWLVKGRPTALGLASGIVAGLVAVTPAAGFVHTWGGAAIGLAAGVVCYFAVQAKSLLGYDDSLDAFGVHGVGGFLGAVLTGVFCYAVIQSASKDGMIAHMGLPGQIEAYKKEADGLKKEIEALKKSEPELQKKSDDAAARVVAAAGDNEKASLQKAADAARADLDALPKKIGRREDRVTAIEKPKSASDAGDKGGLIVQLQGKIDGYEKDKIGAFSQVIIQLKAAVFSAVFAFVISLALAYLVQAGSGGRFRTSVEKENTGLDQTEHQEVGFDYGGIDTVATTAQREPKAAKVPPGGKRFEVVVEGIENGGLLSTWSQLCQPSEAPPDPDFKAVYPYVTTVQGNRFRLRGGDPKALSASIQKLFQNKLGKPVKVRVEE
jgi:ammonium transporter